MLEIRKEQMDALEKGVLNAYIDELIAYYRQCIPSKVNPLSDEVLRDFCRRGIPNARRYGIEDRWDICRFIGYQLLCGEGFESTPPGSWARETLEDDALNGTEKIDYMDYYYVRVLGQSLEEPSVPSADPNGGIIDGIRSNH
jgi:hypothetical protein